MERGVWWSSSRCMLKSEWRDKAVEVNEIWKKPYIKT